MSETTAERTVVIVPREPGRPPAHVTTPVRFGVSRLKPGRKRGRNAHEHKNGGAVIMAEADDPDFHALVKHAAGCLFPGWVLDGYALVGTGEDFQHDPSPEVSGRLGQIGMEKDARECHNYGRGNNAFVGGEELAARVRLILFSAGYVRDAQQHRGHTNYTRASGGRMAQTRKGADGRLHVIFMTTGDSDGQS